MLLCCERTLTCPAESAIVNMLYCLGAALDMQCSKSRCMSHRQPARAAEDTVSRFLYEAFSGRNIKKRERKGEKEGEKGPSITLSDLRVVTSGLSSLPLRRSTCAHATAGMHHGLHAHTGEERRQHSIKYGWVGNVCNLPRGKLR